MKTGVELIADERVRQMEQEGWSPERDTAEHGDSELALAAACYALTDSAREQAIDDSANTALEWLWPWHWDWWKPTPKDRVRELVKAGALIAAEIDRLQAVSHKKNEPVKYIQLSLFDKEE